MGLVLQRTGKKRRKTRKGDGMIYKRVGMVQLKMGMKELFDDAKSKRITIV